MGGARGGEGKIISFYNFSLDFTLLLIIPSQNEILPSNFVLPDFRLFIFAQGIWISTKGLYDVTMGPFLANLPEQTLYFNCLMNPGEWFQAQNWKMV